MKEAPNSPYAKLIFRETFTDEQSVRRNNSGVPTAVIFSSGVGSFNGTSSGIVYPKNFNGTYSIRIRFKEPTSFVSSQYLCDFRKGTGVGYIYCSETTILSPGGTKYVNGAVSDSSIAVKEIVVSGMPITSTELTIGRRTAPFTSYFIGDLELFEIYEGTLTESEVKNLYDNDWNKDLTGYNGQPGRNLVVNGGFDGNADGWTLGSSWKYEDGKIVSNTTAVHNITPNSISITTGRKYLVEIDVVRTSGAVYVYLGDFTNVINTSGRYSKIITAVSNVFSLNASSFIGTIDNISVQELQPNLLLDYDSTNGYITDRTGKNTLTLTGTEAINIVKNGGYSALRTSTGFKQVLGSNIINAQPITVVYWANYNSVALGRYLMDNGTFFIDGSTLNRLRVRSDGSSSAISATNFITPGKTQFIAITRAADGTVTFYSGDLQNAPVSSGTANSGTPAATSTPLTLLGLTSSNSSGFDGKMMMIKVFDGILELETITQIWSSTRGKVN